MLNSVCKTIATEAIHNTPAPCLIDVSGPMIHSPPPIDAASKIAPGPMVFRALPNENGSGSGRSAVSHAGRQPGEIGESWSGGGVEDRSANGALSARANVSHSRRIAM